MGSTDDSGRPLLSACTIGSDAAACESRAPPEPEGWQPAAAAEKPSSPAAARATPEPARLRHVAPRPPPPGGGGGRERPHGQRASQEEPGGRQGRLLLALRPRREARGR